MAIETFLRPCRICGGQVVFEHECPESCDCTDSDQDMRDPVHSRCHDGALRYLGVQI